MSVSIRAANTNDAEAMHALLPSLASFEVPTGRNPDHLWHGDRDMLQRWLDGKAPEVFTLVAADDSDAVLGVAIVSMCEEMLSHEPSAHLEVLAVSATAHRQGLGQRLIQSAQSEAKTRGAGSMSLHVFANNHRARALYEKMGFEGELLRYYTEI